MNSSARLRLVLLVLLVGFALNTAIGYGNLFNHAGKSESATPLYQGFHEGADCNHITGWAADSNLLNTSIYVDIYDGAIFNAKVFANVSRPDVGAFLGDNGKHGFDFPVPVSLKNGMPHSIAVKFAGTTVKLANTPRPITCTSTPTPTPTPPPPPPPPPTPTPTPSTGNQIGRLTSSGNGQRRTIYEYDDLGRATRTVNNFEGQSKAFTTAYGYPQSQINLTGSPGTVATSQTFPDNERVDYTYDASGAQQSIKTTPAGASQQTIVGSIYRNSRGQTIAASYGNGAISIYKYNEGDNLRLNRIQTAVGSTLTITGGVPQLTGGTTWQDYGYSFDNNGNVTGVTDAINSTLSATYDYDSLDQLKSMTSTFVPPSITTKSYVYDKLGNLTNKEGVSQTYYTGGIGRGPHALATSGGVSYNYDANGNLTSTSSGTNITWNSENMATRVVQGGVTMYQKSFLGESLWKKVEPSVTTYYLPSMRIENGLVRKFFGGFAERSPDGSLKFYHGDHLGSASLVTDFVDNVAHVVRRQSYMPYGEDRFVSGTFPDARYQFNFKEKELTFYNYGARLYSPLTGRWLSADDDLTDGFNRYTYVSNNPLRYTDPTGHFQNPKQKKCASVSSTACHGGANSLTFSKVKAGPWTHADTAALCNVAGIICVAIPTPFTVGMGTAFFYAASGFSAAAAIEDFKKGNYLSGSINALGIIPMNGLPRFRFRFGSGLTTLTVRDGKPVRYLFSTSDDVSVRIGGMEHFIGEAYKISPQLGRYMNGQYILEGMRNGQHFQVGQRLPTSFFINSTDDSLRAFGDEFFTLIQNRYRYIRETGELVPPASGVRNPQLFGHFPDAP